MISASSGKVSTVWMPHERNAENTKHKYIRKHKYINTNLYKIFRQKKKKKRSPHQELIPKCFIATLLFQTAHQQQKRESVLWGAAGREAHD